MLVEGAVVVNTLIEKFGDILVCPDDHGILIGVFGVMILTCSDDDDAGDEVERHDAHVALGVAAAVPGDTRTQGHRRDRTRQ